jgi:iron(III) transport system substrate-binding protein
MRRPKVKVPIRYPGGRIAALLVALIVAGCGAASSSPSPAASAVDTAEQQLVAAAKAEGTLTLYGTSSVAALKSDADGFEKRYGVKVSYVQLTSTPLSARVDQEIKAGRPQADVIITADRAGLNRWVQDGVLAKLPEVQFPQKTDYLASIQVGAQGIFVNTSVVTQKDRPKKWADTVQPQFSTKLVLGSPRISPAYSQLYYGLLKDPRYGSQFFDKLAALKPRVVETNVLVAQSVASGEASLGFTALAYDAVNIKQTNPSAPIEFGYLDLVTMTHSYISITAKSSHPKAAELFARWMMSREGQIAHNGSARAGSMLGTLPNTLVMPDPKVVSEVRAEDVSKEYQSLIGLFDRLFK